VALDRRRFLGGAAAALLAASSGGSCGVTRPRPERRRGSRLSAEDREWASVRELFELSPELIHMSALLVSSHPRPVRQAIERYRRELDRDPVGYLEAENSRRQSAALRAAARYLGASPDQVALTDSTTMGIGLVYTGLALEDGDELLATEHDYYSTHEALRLAARRSGARVRQVPLYRSLEHVTPGEIVGNVLAQVTPATRVLALTWVHSATGLKLPIAEIAAALRELDATRPAERPVLLGVDGVHGFGVESAAAADLGCDFFMAGAHKWLFGPRGTGIVWASERGWAAVRPTIPTFMEAASWQAWVRGAEPSGPTNGRRFSPGGFKPFEHQWALAEAFGLHQEIGRQRIERRTHALARRLKEGLAGLPRVRLHTPLSAELSSGIVCFEVAGLSPEAVIDRLRAKQIVATTTPYATRYARLTPSLYNTEGEVDAVLAELAELG
jgi:isopenicillin-N epimerase